jgi:AraC family transcriptional regulator
MDWQDRMNQAITWIEEHLTEEFQWEDAARAASCSPFHFLRMFEVITGMTAGDYVRRRRLSQAALELAAGDAKVIDLALRYGYDSPDSFAKAFRKLFGCTPTEARRPGVRLRSYPPIAFTISLKGAHAMEYRIVQKPAFQLTGVPLDTTTKDGQCFREIPAHWDRCMHDGSFQKLVELIPPKTDIGVAGVNGVPDLDTGAFTYFVAIETPADRAGLPPNCRDVAVPAATWGVFEARGALPKAQQEIMQRIYGEWFPTAGWEHAPAPELEIYPPGNPQSPDYVSEIWIPLQKPPVA